MRGIVVAADHAIAWLLPWWWEALGRDNCLPVCFIDLGLQARERRWCAARGHLGSLKEFAAFDDCRVTAAGRALYGPNYLDQRRAWFKKPFAMLLSPFEETLWLDLDCEVLAPLDPLFAYLKRHPIALALETDNAREKAKPYLKKGEQLFNTGVILFRRQTPLLKAWAAKALQEHAHFISDQELLARLIFEKRARVSELPAIYNWRMSQGVPFDAKIIHWVGNWGKQFIKQHGGFKSLSLEF